MVTSPARNDEAYRKFAVAPARPNSNVPVPELSAPVTDVRPSSPIQRSGSPLRRKQIANLEMLPKKKTRFDGSPLKDVSALSQIAESVERISNTFTATAVAMRDAKVFQKEMMDEILELRREVRQLQTDMTKLLEREQDTRELNT